MSKVCCTCKNDLDFFFFYNNKRLKDGLSSQCKICAKIYRELNKDKVYPSSSIEYKRNYYNKNKKHINNLRQNNRKNNSNIRNKDVLSSKLYYENNKKELKEKMSLYYLNNKEAAQNRGKEYRNKNKEYILQRNRARKNKLLNTITQLDLEIILNSYSKKCAYCGISVEKSENLHFDHVIPLAKNGTHTISNLVPSCAKCNLRKGTKTKEEFVKILENNGVY